MLAGLLRAINKRRCQHPPLDPRLPFFSLSLLMPPFHSPSIDIFLLSSLGRTFSLSSYLRHTNTSTPYSLFLSPFLFLARYVSLLLSVLNFTLCFPLHRFLRMPFSFLPCSYSFGSLFCSKIISFRLHSRFSASLYSEPLHPSSQYCIRILSLIYSSFLFHFIPDVYFTMSLSFTLSETSSSFHI